MVIMASEVGVLDIPPENVLVKERLHPGRIFLVDTAQGRIVDDEEIKRDLARERPYAAWLKQELIHIDDLRPAPGVPAAPQEAVRTRQRAFGYTEEDLRILIAPMAQNGAEPIGSMGTDTALAVLSDRSRLLYDYFKQLFAQVTNPPLDAIREELVTDMGSTLGAEANLLADPDAPVVSSRQGPCAADHERRPGEAAARCTDPAFRTATLPMLFNPRAGAAGLEQAMDRAVPGGQRIRRRSGATLLVLSDRGVDREHAPVPALLATSRRPPPPRCGKGSRTRCSPDRRDRRSTRGATTWPCSWATARRSSTRIWPSRPSRGCVPTARCRTRPGAGGRKQLHQGLHQGRAQGDVQDGHLHAPELPRRAQIFEAVGLDKAFVDRYFTWTASRMGGVGIDTVARDGRPPPRAGVRRARARGRRAGCGRRVPVAPRRRVPPVQSRDRPQAAARQPRAIRPPFTGTMPGSSTTRAASGDAARPARAEAGGRPDPARGGRAGRGRSSSASPPAPCPTARSAPRRTRRWPSP